MPPKKRSKRRGSHGGERMSSQAWTRSPKVDKLRLSRASRQLDGGAGGGSGGSSGDVGYRTG